ncbi:hypothetical protein L596_009061 [Steinernema carpocapsae]|uniref:Uncharacterized protein n=1 Tax=Steinernema carpocapsae TaxID=34508 RepID=A0A4U5PEN4_STECR|nr:hypothetical protein L596_009061 [Steinernema carpocapsae]
MGRFLRRTILGAKCRSRLKFERSLRDKLGNVVLRRRRSSLQAGAIASARFSRRFRRSRATNLSKTSRAKSAIRSIGLHWKARLTEWIEGRSRRFDAQQSGQLKQNEEGIEARKNNQQEAKFNPTTESEA